MHKFIFNGVSYFKDDVLILKNIKIPITSKFLELNGEKNNLQYYIKKLNDTYFSLLEKEYPRYYWGIVFSLIAEDLNNGSINPGYFVTKEDDLLKINQHLIVRYPLVYFNTYEIAQSAIDIMGEKIWEVV